MIQTRDNDYEHYLKCGNCGWEGWVAWMRHGYYAWREDDVEPMDFCPKCDVSEECAEVFITCHRKCTECNDRFICHTVLTNLPKFEIGFYSEGEVYLGN